MADRLGVPLPPGVPAPGNGGDRMFGGPGGPGFGPGMRGGPLRLLPPGMLLGIAIAGSILAAVAFWFIFKKAGYSGLFGLLMAIPGVNVVVLFFLALTEWPVHKELREQRAIASMVSAEKDADGGAAKEASARDEALGVSSA